MRTGESGRVAVYWTQTELDGLESAPLADLSVGASWSWRGPVSNLAAAGQMGLAHLPTESTGLTVSGGAAFQPIEGAMTVYATIELSNGAQSFVADLVRIKGDERAVLIFEHGCPAREQEFWVNSVILAAVSAGYPQADETVVSFPGRGRKPDAVDVQQDQVAGIAAE